MKRLARASSSALFLLELVCSILIFAITCAVCVGLLVRSHNLSQQAERLNLAVREVSSAAELVRGAEDIGSDLGSVEELVYKLWPLAQRTESGWQIHYDGSGSVSAEGSGSGYIFQMHGERDGEFLLVSLIFSTWDGEEIYSQQIERYMPEGGESDAGA